MPLGGWLAFAGGDQIAQASVDVVAPALEAALVTLEARDQPDVREAHRRLAVLLANLEHDVRALPLGLVVDEVEAGIRDVPDHPFARHQVSDLLRTAVDVLVAVGELGAETVGTAGDLSRPPRPHVVDGGEDLGRRLGY